LTILGQNHLLPPTDIKLSLAGYMLKQQAIMDEQADLFEPVEAGIISGSRLATSANW
jgi:hypothetical protein